MEEENRKLKKPLAETLLDAATLKEMLEKTSDAPRSRRPSVNWTMTDKE